MTEQQYYTIVTRCDPSQPDENPTPIILCRVRDGLKSARIVAQHHIRQHRAAPAPIDALDITLNGEVIETVWR